MDIQEIVQELLTDRKKLYGAFFIVAVIFFIDMSYGAGFQVNSLKQQNKRIAKMKQDIASVKQEIAAAGRQDPANAGEFKLYSKEGLPLLLNDVAKFARSNDVQIVQIAALGDRPKPGGKGKQAVPADKASIITSDMKAGYHELGRFLCDLENWQHPLYAEEIKIGKNPENEMRHLVTLKLRTYVKK